MLYFPVKIGVIKRHIHAQWSILLSHEWMSYSIDDIEPSDEPLQRGSGKFLIIHGSYQNRVYCRRLAKCILNKFGNNKVECLSVDLRGHGDSFCDDYEPPHNIEAACDDILTLNSPCSI